MGAFDVFILAIIQGIAEFLPISSSGHLVLVGHWLGIEEAQGSLNIVLHAGTLLSIVVFYFSHILNLLGENRRLIGILMVGSIPAAGIGIIIKLKFDGVLEDEWLAALMLLVTGGILIGSWWLDQRTKLQESGSDDSATTGDYLQLSYRDATWIGLFQALAILPGISRSGSTIFAGQMTGLNRTSAGTFSFLLAIPVIGGAALIETIQLVRGNEATEAVGMGTLIVGALIAFVVGYLSLSLLISFIQKGRFHWFAWWCIPFGIVSLVLLTLGI